MLNHSYIKTLDWVRGFAILSVVLTHFFEGFADFMLNTLWLSGIHPGVIIFIVLSGFVIHYPHAVKLKNDPKYLINIKSFVIRRIIRIYPVLVIVLIIPVFLYSENFSDVVVNLLQSLFLLYAVYPVDAPLNNPILVTVIVEFWLYMQYVFIYRILNLKVIGLLAIGVVNFGIYLLLLYLLKDSGVESYWKLHNLFAFTPFWIIGAISAHILVFRKELVMRYIKSVVFFPLLILWGGVVQNSSVFYYSKPFLFVVFSVIVAAFILYLSTNKFFNKNSVIESKLSKVMIWFGSITYSLYLTHVLVAYTLHNMPYKFFENNLIITLISICVGYLFFIGFERPFHKIARSF